VKKTTILDCNRKPVDRLTIVFENDKVPVQDTFNFMWKMGWMKLATAGLTGREWDVLAMLMHQLQYENTVHAETTRIAKALGISVSNASDCIRALIAKGFFIDTGEKIGRTRILALASTIGYKGDLKKLHRERASLMKNAIKARTEHANRQRT